MPEQAKVEFSQLEAGFEFPPASYQLSAPAVATYLKAVGETSQLYQDTGLVPPTALAAYAMATLSGRISLPPGTIHVSQELEFLDTVNVGDTITCQAKVGRKQERGRLHLMTVYLNVFDQNRQAVLAGKTSFVLPAQN
jgi:acyl dehydratase